MIASVIFWVFLTLAAIIDGKWGIIPDKLNLLATVSLLSLYYYFDPEGWHIRILIAIFLFIALVVSYWLSKKITGRQDVGGGDIKLIFWFGLGLSSLAPVAILWTGFFFGLGIFTIRLCGKWYKGRTLPLIPFLWIGSIFAILVG